MPKCCDTPQSSRPHKCPHLLSFKESGGLESFTSIQKYLQTSRLGFLKIPRPQCSTCATATFDHHGGVPSTPSSPRLHACMQCVFFACWGRGHLTDHFQDENHFLGVDVTHNEVYCHHCKDYVYDPQLDDIVNAEINNANQQNIIMLEPNRTTAYHRWTASKSELANLGKNSNPLNVSKNILGLRGLINLGNTDKHNSKECRHRLRNANAPSPSGSNGTTNSSSNHHHHHANPSSSSPFQDKDSPRNDVCLGCEMDVLFEQIFSGTKTPYTPHHILHSIWKFANYFAGYEQQDAHEFLISSLNGLHTHLERTDLLRDSSPVKHNSSSSSSNHHHNNNNSHNNNRNNNNNNINNNGSSHNDATSDDGTGQDGECNCLVHTIFKGTLRSEVTCASCAFTSVTEDPFFDISLDIPKASSPSSIPSSTPPHDSAIPPAATPPMSPPQPPSPSSSPLSPIVRTGVKRNADEMTQDEFLSPQPPPSAYSNSSTSPPPSVPTHSPILLSSPVPSLQSPPPPAAPPPVSFLTSNSLVHTLSACLERFTQPERLGTDEKFLCSKCHTRQESIKQLSMKSLPVVICFHLKRFEQLANSRHSNKIDTFIEFPSVLDMSPYTSLNVKAHTPHHTPSPSHTSPSDSSTNNSTSNPSTPTSNNNKRATPKSSSDHKHSNNSLSEAEVGKAPEDMFSYHLFAVVNHHGKMDTGHYTCFVKQEQTWYKCDDATITVATLPHVLHSKGYLLFYMKHHLQYAPENSRANGSHAGSPQEKE